MLLLGVWGKGVICEKKLVRTHLAQESDDHAPLRKDMWPRVRVAMQPSDERVEEMQNVPKEGVQDNNGAVRLEMGAYAKYLERHAVKVQSFFRMARYNLGVLQINNLS